MDAKLCITVAGNRFEMRIGDFTALDEFDYFKQTGQTIMEVFNEGKVTSFAVAGLVWLHRRANQEKSLTFEEVARTFKFSDLDSIEFDDGKDEPVEEAVRPEA